MRTRRFRPSFGFRPAAEILMPRIAPSDISLMIYMTGDSPVDPPAPADPYADTDIPVWTGPNEGPGAGITTAPMILTTTTPVTTTD